MKVTNLNLKTALSVVGAAVKERSPIPHYGHVFFARTGDALTLAAFDGSIYIQTGLPHEKINGTEGGFSMPYKPLAQFIEKTGAQTVELVYTENMVKVSADKFSMRSQTLPLDNLTQFVAPESERAMLSLETAEFILNAERALMSASDDHNDVTLASLIVLAQAHKVKFMGFDRFRVAYVNSMETFVDDGMWSIPASVAVNAIKIAKHHKDVAIFLDNNKVWFYFDDGESILSATLNVNMRGMPKTDLSSHDTTFILDAAEFRRALEVAAIFSGDNKIVAIESDGKNLTVKNVETAIDSGDGTSVLPAEITDSRPFSFRINAKAMLDFLSVARSPKIGARFKDGRNLIQWIPMRLKAGDEYAHEFDDDFEYIIAPYFDKEAKP